MSKKSKTDKFLVHEVLDRLHVILSNIDDHLLDHKFVMKNKKIRKQIEKASDILSDCYQEVGRIEFKEDK